METATINKPLAGESNNCNSQFSQTTEHQFINKLKALHVVYYFFSDTGVLLYIGKSSNFTTRWDLHKESEKELSQVFKIIIAEYRTQSEAAFVELNHICKFKPNWNAQGLNGGVSDIKITPCKIYLRVKEDQESIITFNPPVIGGGIHRYPSNNSEYPGVYKTPQGRYVARCCVGKRKRIQIGIFDTPLEATNAYEEFKRKLLSGEAGPVVSES